MTGFLAARRNHLICDIIFRFFPKKDVPLRSDKAVNKLKIAVGIAGIHGDVSHHKLRHSFASELLRNGVNPRTVQELMRHAAIDTLFKHYAHVLRSDLAEAVERI